MCECMEKIMRVANLTCLHDSVGLIKILHQFLLGFLISTHSIPKSFLLWELVRVDDGIFFPQLGM